MQGLVFVFLQRLMQSTVPYAEYSALCKPHHEEHEAHEE